VIRIKFSKDKYCGTFNSILLVKNPVIFLGDIKSENPSNDSKRMKELSRMKRKSILSCSLLRALGMQHEIKEEKDG
jgi:hypothetical protein